MDLSGDTTGELHKEQGNKYFAEGKNREAIECYSKAIELNPQNHIFYSNRAAAYLKTFKSEEALADCHECLKIQPSFVKAYPRMTTALLNLRRFEDCYVAALTGLNLEPGNKLLQEALKAAKRQYICNALQGSWIGQVAEVMGGYDQVFEFTSDDTVKLTVMGRTVGATYTINMDKNPMWLTISIVVPPGMMAPPEMLSIFKFDRDILKEMLEVAERRFLVEAKVSKTQAKKLLKNNVISVDIAAEGDLESSAARTVSPPEELHIASPYLTNDRPKSFEGPTYCVMKRANRDDEHVKLLLGERIVAPEIAAMTFHEQVNSFAKKMLEILPTKPLAEPTENDRPEVAMAKMAESQRVQSKMMLADFQYPEEVSMKVERYMEDQEEIPLEVADMVHKLKERMIFLGYRSEKDQAEIENKVRMMTEEAARKKAQDDVARIKAEHKAKVNARKQASTASPSTSGTAEAESAANNTHTPTDSDSGAGNENNGLPMPLIVGTVVAACALIAGLVYLRKSS